MDNPSDYNLWDEPDGDDDDLINAYILYLISLVGG
jgi:hypothetical protein